MAALGGPGGGGESWGPCVGPLVALGVGVRAGVPAWGPWVALGVGVPAWQPWVALGDGGRARSGDTSTKTGGGRVDGHAGVLGETKHFVRGPPRGEDPGPVLEAHMGLGKARTRGPPGLAVQAGKGLWGIGGSRVEGQVASVRWAETRSGQLGSHRQLCRPSLASSRGPDVSVRLGTEGPRPEDTWSHRVPRPRALPMSRCLPGCPRTAAAVSPTPSQKQRLSCGRRGGGGGGSPCEPPCVVGGVLQGPGSRTGSCEVPASSGLGAG